MDAFHNYDNLAGFFVGNEVLTTGANSIAAPYVKAATRDMKAYRDSKGYRQIPIGYSAADIASLRPNLQKYMACGDNSSDALDFFSLNAYEWCGETTYETVSCDQLLYPTQTDISAEWLLSAPTERQRVQYPHLLLRDRLQYSQASHIRRSVRHPWRRDVRYLVRRHRLRMDPRSQRLRPHLLRAQRRPNSHRC